MKTKILYLIFALITVISSILIVSCNDSGEPSGSPIETLDAPANIRVDKRIVTWDSVENASGYSVKFENIEYKTTEPTFDLHFHGDGGEYDIQVKAIADGKSFWSSNWSEVATITLQERVAEGYDELGFSYALLEDESGYEISRGKANLEGNITIPDYYMDYPVKRIGNCAFFYLGKVDGSAVPDCFTEILCNKVTTGIKLPEHLESIGNGAFRCMIKLEEIVIPDSVTEIGINAFDGCKSLTRVVLPKSLKVIPNQCFMNTALTEINLPDTLEEIGGGAFRCTYEEATKYTVTTHINSALSSIIIPSSVKSIGDGAFVGRENLKSIILSDTVEEFGIQVFHETKWYNEHPDGMMLLGIGECFLYEYRGEIPNGGVIDTLPSNIKGLCPYAFRDTNLTKIVIPNGVRLVGEWVFASAKSLSEVIIPYDWEIIKPFTFNGTVSLKSITIPENIKKIEAYAFGSSGLEKIVIPESITVIDRYAFGDAENLTEIILPQTLTSIEEHAFFRTKSLKTIVLPDSLTYIGKAAFNQSGIESITIPSSVTTIDRGCFSNCNALTEISLPESLTSIGNGVFYRCTALEKIVLPESLTSIEKNIFLQCDALTAVYYKGSVAGWNKLTAGISISDKTKTVYFYSETKPETEGKYWHYVDGKPTVWNEEQ
jgi:hypothetical protein